MCKIVVGRTRKGRDNGGKRPIGIKSHARYHDWSRLLKVKKVADKNS